MRVTTYKPENIAFEYGNGPYLYSDENIEYLDCISGIGACSLGHSHNSITKVIHEQSQKLHPLILEKAFY